MENETITGNETKEPKTHLNYGTITGVVLIVLFVLYYVMNLFMNRTLQFIPSIIFIILIILAQSAHAKALGRPIKFGDLFAMGFKTAVVATCIYVVFLIIFLIAVPSYKEQVMEVARQQMVAKGNLTQEQINAGIKMARKFFTLSTIGGAIIGELISGCIGALIGAAIIKKKP